MCLTGCQPQGVKAQVKAVLAGFKPTAARMIDYLALSIGHGLLAIGFLRLVMREGLNVDPLLERFRQTEKARRKARLEAARARRGKRAERG